MSTKSLPNESLRVFRRIVSYFFKRYLFLLIGILLLAGLLEPELVELAVGLFMVIGAFGVGNLATRFAFRKDPSWFKKVVDDGKRELVGKSY